LLQLETRNIKSETIKMTIKRFALEDAAILSQLAIDTFYNTFKGTCTDEDMDGFLFDYFNIEQVKKELSDSEDYFYYVEVDGKAVGYLRYKKQLNNDLDFLQNRNALELKRLYVLDEYHGKGIAQALTNHFLDIAKKEQYELVFLGVWEHNYKAQNFYTKMGFEDTGHRHPFPIGNTPQTDCWYWKFL